MINSSTQQEIKLLEQDLCQAIYEGDSESAELYRDEKFELKENSKWNQKYSPNQPVKGVEQSMFMFGLMVQSSAGLVVTKQKRR